MIARFLPPKMSVSWNIQADCFELSVCWEGIPNYSCFIHSLCHTTLSKYATFILPQLARGYLLTDSLLWSGMLPSCRRSKRSDIASSVEQPFSGATSCLTVKFKCHTKESSFGARCLGVVTLAFGHRWLSYYRMLCFSCLPDLINTLTAFLQGLGGCSIKIGACLNSNVICKCTIFSVFSRGSQSVEYSV